MAQDQTVKVPEVVVLRLYELCLAVLLLQLLVVAVAVDIRTPVAHRAELVAGMTLNLVPRVALIQDKGHNLLSPIILRAVV